MWDEKGISERVQAELSPFRFGHTVGVVQTAGRLAERYGISVERARIAAWVHDVAREWPIAKLVQMAEKIEVPSGFGGIPKLLHGPVAAVLLKDWFDVWDDEMANAIRYHTTGRIGMTLLDKVIYLADAIEPGRDYVGVERVRALAATDIDRALVESIDNTLRHLLDHHKPIFPLTVMVRNDLWEQVDASEREATV